MAAKVRVRAKSDLDVACPNCEVELVLDTEADEYECPECETAIKGPGAEWKREGARAEAGAARKTRSSREEA